MRLPWVSRDTFEEMRVMYERRLLDARQERLIDQGRYDKLFASYEKLRNTGHQPPPPPAPRTFADPAEEPLARLEDGMRTSLVQRFRDEGHSEAEAEQGVNELLAAFASGAM